MRICCSLPVALSFACTETMPFASISNVTSICGTPRGAEGMPVRSKLPSSLLSAAISRSPWNTLMVTACWLSSAVEKVWLFFVGMVVFRSINRVNTPPSVSMPSDKGVTSSSRTSFTSPFNTPPCTAAPMATTSSGLTLRAGSLPKNDLTTSMTFGIRVIPPTRITSWISLADRPASFKAALHGSSVREIRSSTSDSSFARESFITRCFGPEASAVMNGRLTSVSLDDDSSILAFSAASLSRCSASLSRRRSMPWSLRNSSAR